MYTKDCPPSSENIRDYVDSPLWNELCSFIEETYSVLPSIEHSVCSMAPGFNVKYKARSKSLCTLYPDRHSFTCLFVVGKKDAFEVEAALPSFDPHISELYSKTSAFNGTKWLMIEMTNPSVLESTKELLKIKCKPKEKSTVLRKRS